MKLFACTRLHARIKKHVHGFVNNRELPTLYLTYKWQMVVENSVKNIIWPWFLNLNSILDIFSSGNFCRGCQGNSCTQIGWRYLVTLRSWIFLKENTVFDLCDPCMTFWPWNVMWHKWEGDIVIVSKFGDNSSSHLGVMANSKVARRRRRRRILRDLEHSCSAAV